MTWASAAIQFWRWALALVAEGAFPQEDIADAVPSRAEAEIARHSAAMQPVSAPSAPNRYGPTA